MLRSTNRRGNRLPKHWSRHIRSAIVHATSMATIAFTHALARAANHPDAQLRARAEIDRVWSKNSTDEKRLSVCAAGLGLVTRRRAACAVG